MWLMQARNENRLTVATAADRYARAYVVALRVDNDYERALRLWYGRHRAGDARYIPFADKPPFVRAFAHAKRIADREMRCASEAARIARGAA